MRLTGSAQVLLSQHESRRTSNALCQTVFVADLATLNAGSTARRSQSEARQAQIAIESLTAVAVSSQHGVGTVRGSSSEGSQCRG